MFLFMLVLASLSAVLRRLLLIFMENLDWVCYNRFCSSVVDLICFVLDGTTVLPEPGAPERTDMPAVLAMYKALTAEPPKTAWLVATGEFDWFPVMVYLAYKL
jgi:hypothetical protein